MVNIHVCVPPPLPWRQPAGPRQAPRAAPLRPFFACRQRRPRSTPRGLVPRWARHSGSARPRGGTAASKAAAGGMGGGGGGPGAEEREVDGGLALVEGPGGPPPVDARGAGGVRAAHLPASAGQASPVPAPQLQDVHVRKAARRRGGGCRGPRLKSHAVVAAHQSIGHRHPPSQACRPRPWEDTDRVEELVELAVAELATGVAAQELAEEAAQVLPRGAKGIGIIERKGRRHELAPVRSGPEGPERRLHRG